MCIRERQVSHGPRAVGIVARRAAIARAPQADLELILSGSEPLADVVVHVLEVRYIQRTGGDPVSYTHLLLPIGRDAISPLFLLL